MRAARGSALLAVGAFEECEAELCGVLAAAEAGLGSSHEVTEECRAQVGGGLWVGWGAMHRTRNACREAGVNFWRLRLSAEYDE